MEKEQQKNNPLAKGIMMGAGLVALAAAAAGTYFLYGSKNATKNRKKVKAWMLKARGEILEQLENASEVSQEMYQNIVKEVAEKYKMAKGISQREAEEFIRELKGHWKSIEKDVKAASKKKK